MKKINKVSEERYFRSDSELISFIERSFAMSYDEICDMGRHNSWLHEVLMPHGEIMRLKDGFVTMRIGRFICMVGKGNYNRTSGRYIYNVLAVQNTDILTGYDMMSIFNYSNSKAIA